METDGLVNKNLQNSIKSNVKNSSSPKRRSLVSSDVNFIVTSKDVINNDEQERQQNREQEENNRRLSQILTQLEAPKSPQVERAQLMKHFNLCIKMNAENKINVQNAWNLHIIDYMKKMIQGESTTQMFQVASATLDLSTKVYGLRVDDIYAEGMKLANSMARNAAKAKHEEDDSNSDNEGNNKDQTVMDGKEKESSNRKRKYGKFKKTALVHSPEDLLSDVTQLDVAYGNSTLIKDKQTTDQMFVNTLHLNHDGNSLLSMSDDFEFGPKKIEQKSREQEVPNLLAECDLTNLYICPMFTDFIIDKFNPKDNQSFVNESITFGDTVFDDEGLPIPELDGSLCLNPFKDAEHDDIHKIEDLFAEDELAEGLQLQGEIAHVVDFRPDAANNQSNDYIHNISITNPRALITNLWAGPSHWKIRHIQNRVNVKYTGKGEMLQKFSRAKKTKVEEIPVEFNPIEIDSFDFGDEDSHALKTNSDVERHIIPIETGINLNFPHSMFMTRKRIILEFPTNVNGKETNLNGDNFGREMDIEVDEYFDYNHDADDYCSKSFVNSDEFNEAQEHVSVMNNLVDAPELIPKTYMNYATKAKKMDMKKLKSFFWETMSTKTEISSKYPNKEECIFSAVYTELPYKLPKKMKEDLSVHLAFVSLLHLANENSLELEKIGPSDFKIYTQKT